VRASNIYEDLPSDNAAVWTYAVGAGGSRTLTSIDSYPTYFYPQGVTVSPSANYLYEANGGGSVSAFKIGSDGTLSSKGETTTPSEFPLGIAIATK
jgi:6-phosphogluconolactonase (cycloisomerase 2 family)